MENSLTPVVNQLTGIQPSALPGHARLSRIAPEGRRRMVPWSSSVLNLTFVQHQNHAPRAQAQHRT